MAGLTMGTWWSLVGMSLAAMGFYGSKGPFFAMPPMFLSGTALAAGFAWINSIGNLGGFFGLALLSFVSAVVCALFLHIPDVISPGERGPALARRDHVGDVQEQRAHHGRHEAEQRQPEEAAEIADRVDPGEARGQRRAAQEHRRHGEERALRPVEAHRRQRHADQRPPGAHGQARHHQPAGARHSSGASWSSGPRASGSLMIMSERDARGPKEHEKTRHWSGAPPAIRL